MKKFQVTIDGTFNLIIDVEAESKEAAIEVAKAEITNADLNTDIEEIKVHEID